MKLTNGLFDLAWCLPSDLSSSQARLLLEKSPPPGAKLRKYAVEAVLNAILYLIKTGYQWRMPPHFPKWRTVYNHFRSWSERGWFQTTVMMRREDISRNDMPTVGIIDSQSIRQVLPQSEKGVDGYKRVKEIKRHIVTDSQGYPLTVFVTTANDSDAKSAYPVVFNAMEKIPSIRLFKEQSLRRTRDTAVLWSTLCILCRKAACSTSSPISGNRRSSLWRVDGWWSALSHGSVAYAGPTAITSSISAPPSR